MLLPKNNTVDLKYRFRFFASIVLSNSKENFKENYEYFGQLYDLRSKIVHGTEDYMKSYKKFSKLIIKWNIDSLKDDLILKTWKEVSNHIISKILLIIHFSINNNFNIPDDFENISKIISQIKAISD